MNAVEIGPCAEFDAGGIFALRPIEIVRQRNPLVPSFARIGDAALRPAQDFRNRHAFVGGDRDEGGIGAVLKKPPHQISQQIAMAADWCVHAAHYVRQLRKERRVERLPHAVQALELETGDAAAPARSHSRR